MPNGDEQNDILRIDVTGKDSRLWSKVRDRLLVTLDRALDTVIDAERGTTLGEEGRALTTALLDHLKARLAKSGLDNERIAAEVNKLYQEVETQQAVTRKTHAEADKIEFENRIKELHLALGTAKALLIGETGEEAILFSQQIDKMLALLRELVS